MICDTCQNQIDLHNTNPMAANFYCTYRKEELIYYDGDCEGYIKEPDNVELTENNLKLEMEYDEGLTSYVLKDTRIKDEEYDMMDTLLRIDVCDGNFKEGSEDKYHRKVKRFIDGLIKDGEGWND